MKYLVPLLLALCACEPSKPQSWVCITPFTPLGGVRFDESDSRVKDLGPELQMTTAEGAIIRVPKGLCVEVVE